MRRFVSWKRLVIVAAATGVVVAGTCGVHVVQLRRQSSHLKDQAIKAEEAAAADPAKAEEAIDLLEQYLKFKKTDEDGNRRYVKLLAARPNPTAKQTAAAADALENYLRLFPDHPDDRKRLVDLYVKLGRLNTAKQHIQMLFDGGGDAKDDVDLLDKAAVCELGPGGDFAQAVRLLDSAVATKRATPAVFERLLGMLHANKQFSDPRYTDAKYLELLNDEPYRSAVEMRVVAGRYLVLRGDPRGARDHIAAALAMEGGKTNADALAAAAEVELAEIKSAESLRPQLKKAQAYLQTAFDLHPRDVRVCLLLARVLNDQGERAKAVGVLRTAADALGETNDQFVMVVDRLLDLQEKDLAAKLIDRIAANEADDKLAKYLRGRLALIEQDWPRARGLFEEVAPVVARVPEFHKKTMTGLGVCYDLLQNPDKQLECFSAALKTDPQYLPAVVGEAEALYKLGRLRDALPWFHTLVDGYKLEAYRPRLARLELRAVVKLPAGERKWAAFEESLGPVAARTPELEVLYAESLAARNQVERAVELLRAVVEKDPKFTAGWVALARVRGGGRPETALPVLDEAAKAGGDSVDLRLARSVVAATRSRRATPAELRALGDGASAFPAAEQNRLWRGLGEAASRVAASLPPADAAGMYAVAVECFQKAGELDRTDLVSRAVLVDLGLAAGRPEVVSAALDGVAAVEGPGGPIGTLGRVIARLPDVRKIADKPARERAIHELRDLALKAKAARPGWGRASVALARLDDLEGLNADALTNYREALDKGERDEFVIRRVVELLRDRRQDDQAAALLNTLHTEVALPEDLERFRVIKDLLSRNIPKSARPSIESVAPFDVKDWRVLLLRGSLFAAIEDDAEAERAFLKAVELGDNVPDTWGALVSHLARVGKTDAARRAVGQGEGKLASSRFKNEAAQAELMTTLAACHELLGDRATAEARYRAAARTAPTELNPTRQLVLFLQRADKMPEGNAMLDQLADSPAQDLARWARRHLALTMMARPDAYANRAAALQLIERNVAVSPNDPEDVKARAVVQTVDPATREDGLKTLREFAKWGDLTPDEFYLLGRQLFDQGKVFESVDFFEQAARPRPGLNNEHLAALVRIYLGLNNNTPRARAAADRLKAFAPRSWDAAREEARVLHREAADALKAGSSEKAKALTAAARDLILKFPGAADEAFARTRSGPLLEELGFPADAEALYARIMADGKSPAAHFPLAKFYVHQKRSAEAIALARKYDSTTPAPATAELLTGAVRAKNPGPDLVRDVTAWLDAALAAPRPKWEELVLLGAKAELLDATGRHADAVAAYEEAIRQAKAAPPEDAKRVDPGLWVNNMAMLMVLLRAADADRAIALLTEQILVRGPAPAFLDTRAVAYLVKGGKADAAAADLKLALIQRQRPEYLFHLAWAYDLTSGEQALSKRFLDEAKKAGLTPDDLHPLEVKKYAELYQPK